MDFDEALHARRSVRDYTGAAVDEAVLKSLIDAAVQAPSAVNEQPWSFTVVRDQKVLDRISIASKAHVLKFPPKGMPMERLRERLGDPEFHVFYHAPALIVISSGVDNRWAVENCALAAENLMLAAAAGGLGSCWIGFAQEWLGTAEGKATIELAPNSVPVAPIIVGRPKALPAPVPRNRPRIHWIGS